MKILLSVVRNRVLIITMSNLPGAVLERSRQGTSSPHSCLDRHLRAAALGIQMSGSTLFLWEEVHLLILKHLCIGMCLCRCPERTHLHRQRYRLFSRNPRKLASAEPLQPLRVRSWELEKWQAVDYQNDKRCKWSAILKLCSYLSNGYYLQLSSLFTY